MKPSSMNTMQSWSRQATSASPCSQGLEYHQGLAGLFAIDNSRQTKPEGDVGP